VHSASGHLAVGTGARTAAGGDSAGLAAQGRRVEHRGKLGNTSDVEERAKSH
jgi:hypothetical protein